MTEPEDTMRLVSALWHSNFRNIEIRDNYIQVREESFGVNGLALLADLATSYNCDLTIRSSGTGFVRARFDRKEV